METLKLMTYNVGEWFDGRSPMVPDNHYEEFFNLHNDIFNEEKPDILVTQEITELISKSKPALNLLKPYFKYNYFQNASEMYVGKGVSSNLEIYNLENHKFNDQKRNYTRFNIKFNNKEILIFSVHLSLDIIENSKEIDELLDLVKNEPYFIIAGDFNIGCSNKNDPIYEIAYKKFLDLGYNIANGDKFGFIETFFRGNNDNRCYDQIVTSKSIDIVECFSNKTKLERNLVEHLDHIPLIAKLRIN